MKQQMNQNRLQDGGRSRAEERNQWGATNHDLYIYIYIPVYV